MLYPEEVYAFTANNKYTRRNRGRFTHYHFKCNYRKKHFLLSSVAFLKSTLNSQHFFKKISPIVYVFLKLLILKDGLLKRTKGAVSKKPSTMNVLRLVRRISYNLNVLNIFVRVIRLQNIIMKPAKELQISILTPTFLLSYKKPSQHKTN